MLAPNILSHDNHSFLHKKIESTDIFLIYVYDGFEQHHIIGVTIYICIWLHYNYVIHSVATCFLVNYLTRALQRRLRLLQQGVTLRKLKAITADFAQSQHAVMKHKLYRINCRQITENYSYHEPRQWFIIEITQKLLKILIERTTNEFPKLLSSLSNFIKTLQKYLLIVFKYSLDLLKHY